MIDTLLQSAIAGTAHAADHQSAPQTPADDLVASSHAGAREQQLLLTAGARAIYRQAGYQPKSSQAPPEPAPAEQQAACRPGAERLLERIFAGEHDDLLPEALDRLARAEQRLPAALLPAALARGAAARDEKLCRAIALVIGERGRWLSRFNEEWSWVSGAVSSLDDAIPPDAETIWQEGTSAQRLELLRTIRSHEPARAREWLAQAWKLEKADFRSQAVQALETGLSAGDEPFLESALDDRSQAVRSCSALLLCRISESAFAVRARERASTMLHYSEGSSGGLRSLVRTVSRRPAGRLEVHPPQEIDTGARRDGIDDKPPPGVGERAWWLTQTIALVPPRYWQEWLQAEPDALIAAARRNTQWGEAVIDGWLLATERHRDADWAASLWSLVDERGASGRASRPDLAARLVNVLRTADAERLIAERLASADDRLRFANLSAALYTLPTPWGRELGSRYLDTVRTAIDHARGDRNWIQSQDLHAVRDSLRVAARSLPSGCLEQALQDWRLPDASHFAPADSWTWRHFVSALDAFTETIQFRQRLIEEIPG